MRNLQFRCFPPVFFLVLMITFGINGGRVVSNLEDSSDYKLCTSELCKEAGDEIINNINQSVDPCDNFYMHTCGRWTSNHEEDITQLDILTTKIQTLLREMLQTNETSDNETLRKVRDYYRSCVDLDTIEAKGLTQLMSIVSANGDWPLIHPSGEWRPEDKNLTLQKIHDYYAKVTARPALFNIEADPDPSDPSVKILRLIQPIWLHMEPVPPQYSRALERKKRYLEDDNKVTYPEVVALDFAALNGFHVSPEDIKMEINKMYTFTFSLSELYDVVMSDDFENGKMYKVTTIAKIQSTWNTAISEHPEYSLDWLETIRSVFNGTGITIDETEEILLMPGNIIEKLANLLKQHTLREIANYIHWYAIDGLAPHTNKKMRMISNIWATNDFENADIDDQRSNFCIDHHIMSQGLSYAYVQKYFDNNLSRKAIEIVAEIQAEMEQQFNQITWMDEESKMRSIQKIINLRKNIGYPEWYDEPGKMEEYYRELVVGPDYFENILSYNRYKKIKSLKQLLEPNVIHKNVWSTLPTKLHAFYTPEINTMTVPAAIFQTLQFKAEGPLAMNYGSAGAVIGHEISHGFSEIGIMYNEFDIIKQWWSNSTIARYKEKMKCFVDQYSNYTLVENYMNKTIKVNGKRTLRENTADNIGFATALKAYLSYKKNRNLEDIRIPGLKNDTDIKHFFYALGNHYCASKEPKPVEYLWHYFEHSPFAVRVNVALSNLPEFSKSFNCPIGSRMNPVKKCMFFD